jgi:aminopeptidase N
MPMRFHRERELPQKDRGFSVILAAMMSLALVALTTLQIQSTARADEPYAPSRDYDLQDIRTHLWFDGASPRFHGEVTERVAALRDGVADLKFDSVGLHIEEVAVDGVPANFSTTPTQLIVRLDRPATRGQRHEVRIGYTGQPKRGLYFILPNQDYPHQPREVWTQGEAEDTRYYIPIYDYPNDRTTSEMLLTVPADWITVSNGRLLGVKNENDGRKTWDWKQSQPLSTYLISAIAGEFEEQEDSWNGVPLRFLVPRGENFEVQSTFARTKQMLDLFSSKLGVPYPWAQYAQTSVDEFTEGGMENTSATTLSVRDLLNPKLLPEMRIGDDFVISHEMAHQWFGDLVTCKDWANLWLNEGFATFFEHYWMEHRIGADEAAYDYWTDRRGWFAQKRLFPVPIVTRDFDDSTKYAGNVYDKAGWVVEMLRRKLGDDDFFAALHQYLTVNRGQNVVTADLQKAIEQSTGVNVDRFFHQWIYGAGAPEFNVAYSYDPAAHQIKLDVTQTQKVEGAVGLFDVPIEIEVATDAGTRTYSVEVSQATQSFTFPADGAPLMVVFDKGGQILKSVEFQKDPPFWIYQLKNAETIPDRADAAVALGAVHNNPAVIAALADSAQHDRFWGIRAEALKALAKIGGPDAETAVLTGLHDSLPWVRDVAARALGDFKGDRAVAATLASTASDDPAYRVRVAALLSIADIKAPGAFDQLTAAVHSDSPDDMLRNAALEGLGTLGDERAVPILLDWSAAGKPLPSRREAIGSLATMDKKDKSITAALISYLKEPYFEVRLSAIMALGAREDATAIAPLEALLDSGDLPTEQQEYLRAALSALKAQRPGD